MSVSWSNLHVSHKQPKKKNQNRKITSSHVTIAPGVCQQALTCLHSVCCSGYVTNHPEDCESQQPENQTDLHPEWCGCFCKVAPWIYPKVAAFTFLAKWRITRLLLCIANHIADKSSSNWVPSVCKHHFREKHLCRKLSTVVTGSRRLQNSGNIFFRLHWVCLNLLRRRRCFLQSLLCSRTLRRWRPPISSDLPLCIAAANLSPDALRILDTIRLQRSVLFLGVGKEVTHSNFVSYFSSNNRRSCVRSFKLCVPAHVLFSIQLRPTAYNTCSTCEFVQMGSKENKRLSGAMCIKSRAPACYFTFWVTSQWRQNNNMLTTWPLNTKSGIGVTHFKSSTGTWSVCRAVNSRRMTHSVVNKRTKTRVEDCCSHGKIISKTS